MNLVHILLLEVLEIYRENYQARSLLKEKLCLSIPLNCLKTQTKLNSQ